MNCFGLTDPGKTRTENQDSFLIENCEKASCVILALCDGMGGANAGGLASQLSCKAFVNYVYNHLTNYSNRPSDYPRIMREACEEANGVAFAYSQFGDNLTGMGTTMVAAIMRRNGSGYVLNVGDSRAYFLHRRVLRQISKDHSLVEELLDAGIITPDQAVHHPQKNVITRARTAFQTSFRKRRSRLCLSIPRMQNLRAGTCWILHCRAVRRTMCQ